MSIEVTGIVATEFTNQEHADLAAFIAGEFPKAHTKWEADRATLHPVPGISLHLRKVTWDQTEVQFLVSGRGVGAHMDEEVPHPGLGKACVYLIELKGLILKNLRGRVEEVRAAFGG